MSPFLNPESFIVHSPTEWSADVAVAVVWLLTMYVSAMGQNPIEPRVTKCDDFKAPSSGIAFGSRSLGLKAYRCQCMTIVRLHFIDIH